MNEMSIPNEPIDNGKCVHLIDSLRYYVSTDGKRHQVMAAGWVIFHGQETEPIRVRAEAPAGVKTEITYVDRRDVADMYDCKSQKIGFRVFMTADKAPLEAGKPIRLYASCESHQETETEILSLTTEDLETVHEEPVHYMEDQFALNGTIVRMAGWGYLSEGFEEYRPIEVWAKDRTTGAVVARAEKMLRPDLDAFFGNTTGQWGFFLLLDLKDHPDCDLYFGEESCSQTKRLNLSDLQREKRESRRRYKSKWEMLLKADPMQKEDDRYYKAHLSKDAYRALIEQRLQWKDVDYDVWMRRHVVQPEAELQQQRNQVAKFEKKPLISLAVPAFRTPEQFLREMIDSVRAQTYENWELCIADGSMDGSLTPILAEYQTNDPRIRYVTLTENYGISGNTNEALKITKGDYIALVDHDDVITPDALYELVNCVLKTGADCVYSDEDKTDLTLEDYFEPHFKPDFNPDMLRSCNYICHLFMVRRDVMERAGLFRPEYDGSQDFDFILRCTSQARNVQHVRKMLYHWRSHIDSTAMNPENKMYCYTAGRNAIFTDLQTHGYAGAEVNHYTRLGYYEPVYPLPKRIRVTILTTEESAERLEILRKTGKLYFNTQILTVNGSLTESLREAAGDILLFLHGDVREASPDWIERLSANAVRPEVGVIGAMVYNELGRISASGKIIRPNGQLMDLFRGLLKEEPGYAAHALMQQDVSVVSDKCLCIRRDVFTEIGGETIMTEFGIEHAAKLCKRVLDAAKLVVYTPFIRVKEKETPEDEDILIQELATGQSDPHYHPAFDAEGEPFRLAL